jgi:hypothetical protein
MVSDFVDTMGGVLNLHILILALFRFCHFLLSLPPNRSKLRGILNNKIADEIKKIVDVATDPWGIDVSTIKIQDIELPADMKRVMAKQAEAERERRAIIIQAEGEYTASQKLSQAARVLSFCALAEFRYAHFKRLKKLTQTLQKLYSLPCRLSLWKESNPSPVS